VLNILIVIRLLSILMTCPAHVSLLIFMYLTKSGSSYNLYNLNYMSCSTALHPAQKSITHHFIKQCYNNWRPQEIIRTMYSL
jgi:hypothetical protein